MQDLFILALAAVTSWAAYLVGRRRLRLTPGGLRSAAIRLLECVGLAVLFLLANHALGIAAIVAARAVTGGFVSLYLIDDASLGVLSVLQALVFAWWRHGLGNRAERPEDRGSRSQ
jgi:hypothetical protein